MMDRNQIMRANDDDLFARKHELDGISKTSSEVDELDSIVRELLVRRRNRRESVKSLRDD